VANTSVYSMLHMVNVISSTNLSTWAALHNKKNFFHVYSFIIHMHISVQRITFIAHIYSYCLHINFIQHAVNQVQAILLVHLQMQQKYRTG